MIVGAEAWFDTPLILSLAMVTACSGDEGESLVLDPEGIHALEGGFFYVTTEPEPIGLRTLVGTVTTNAVSHHTYILKPGYKDLQTGTATLN